jgi:hypothetical protein
VPCTETARAAQLPCDCADSMPAHHMSANNAVHAAKDRSVKNTNLALVGV